MFAWQVDRLVAVLEGPGTAGMDTDILVVRQNWLLSLNWVLLAKVRLLWHLQLLLFNWL